MTVIIVPVYVIAVLILCVFVVFPDFRIRQLLRVKKASGLAISSIKSFFWIFHQWMHSGSAELRTGVASGLSTVMTHRWWILTASLVITLPVTGILLMRHEVELSGYADTVHTNDAVVSALLAGEQLVPPPPLPPEVFTTREVLAVRPALVSASRDWNLLDVSFQQRLLRVFQRMREHGYEMVLLEGYRSPQRQNSLAAMGSHVTNAVAFQSYHQYGLAADSAFMRNGKLVISERDEWAMRGYQLYGQEAEAMGLTWGGRWKMMDFGHVELRRPRNELRAPVN